MINDPQARSAKTTTANAGRAQHGPLCRLDDLDDYEIADGEPDPRGWDVKTTDGRTIGEVDNLIAERAAMQVRYLDIELDKKALNLKDSRHVLVPVGRVRLDDNDDAVRLDRVSLEMLAALPEYQHGVIDDAFEDRVHGVLETGAVGANRYGHESFDDKRFFGKRRGARADAKYLTLSEEQVKVGKRSVKTGEAAVHTEVDTKHVARTVPTSHEEIVVERRPASASTPAKAEIGEKAIRVPLMAEEAVVEKRTVPTEEVIISKRTVAGSQKVEADVRKERVVVDKPDTRGRNDKETPRR